jgi:type VI secretion system secreted protein Hcp
MALNAYLRLRADRQGDIRGDATEPGREDSIVVMGVTHEIISPRDAASGLPTGRRVHRPITLTKRIDKSSPLLASVLSNNENISAWTLRFWRPGPDGAEQQYYTIELAGAAISGIRLEMLNNTYPENAPLAVREHVTFTYRRITWTYTEGGVTATDDWELPQQ